MRYSRALCEVALLAVCIVWGFIGPVVKVCSSDIDPLVLAVLRYVFSSLICSLAIVSLSVLWGGRAIARYLTCCSFLRVGRYALPNVIVSVIASVLGFGVSIPAFFVAVKIAGVYLTYVIGISLSVIVVSMMRVMLGQEMLTKYKVSYCALLTALCAYTAMSARPGLEQMMYIVLFAVPWGLYTVLISFINRRFRKVSEIIQSTLIDVLVSTLVGTISVILIFNIGSNMIAHGLETLSTRIVDLLLTVLFLALTATVLAYIATYVIVGLRPETVVLLSIFQFIEVIQGIIIGALYFREIKLTMSTISYLCVSITALVVCSWLRQLEVKRQLRRISS